VLNLFSYGWLSKKIIKINSYGYQIRIISIAGKSNTRVLVLYIPDVVQLNYPELQAINQIVSEICMRLKTDFLDITKAFEGTPNLQSLYLLPHDAHTSPYGHEIIAKEIEKKIQVITRNIHKPQKKL